MQLSPYNSLITLPLPLLVLRSLLATHPLSLFMQRHGRRPGLTVGAAAGVLGGLVSASGGWLENFVLFCLGALPIGVYQASAMYYRFAALETVDDAHKGRAAAWAIAGGICAALIAPSLRLWARNAVSGLTCCWPSLRCLACCSSAHCVKARFPWRRAATCAACWPALLPGRQWPVRSRTP